MSGSNTRAHFISPDGDTTNGGTNKDLDVSFDSINPVFDKFSYSFGTRSNFLGKLQLAKVKMLSRAGFLSSFIVYTFKELGMEMKLHYDYSAEIKGIESFWESIDYANHGRQLACFIIVLVSLYLTNRQNCHMWCFVIAFLALTAQ